MYLLPSVCTNKLCFCISFNFFLCFLFSVHEWIRLDKEWLTSCNPAWTRVHEKISLYRVCRSFANRFQFSLVPLQITHVCLFAVHLAMQGKSHATIRNYSNSLSTCGQLQGYSSLNLQNVFICLTLRGILWMVKIESSIALPMSFSMLNKNVHHIEFVNLTIPFKWWCGWLLSLASTSYYASQT